MGSTLDTSTYNSHYQTSEVANSSFHVEVKLTHFDYINQKEIINTRSTRILHMDISKLEMMITSVHAQGTTLNCHGRTKFGGMVQYLFF